MDADWLIILRHKLANRATRGLHIHLFGAPTDRKRLEGLGESILIEFEGARCINHAGNSSVLESLLLITGLEELLCVDSALLHFARLAGVRTTSLWGPTNPVSFIRPQSSVDHVIVYEQQPCSPCVHMLAELPCKGNNFCMHKAALAVGPCIRDSVATSQLVPSGDAS